MYKTEKPLVGYHGLDKTGDFGDFKGKYLQASAIVQNQQSVSSNFGNISDYNELENYFQKKYNINIDNSMKKLNLERVGMHEMIIFYMLTKNRHWTRYCCRKDRRKTEFI
jgi:hypothetical protein